jgi:hypothetical protein
MRFGSLFAHKTILRDTEISKRIWNFADSIIRGQRSGPSDVAGRIWKSRQLSRLQKFRGAKLYTYFLVTACTLTGKPGSADSCENLT